MEEKILLNNKKVTQQEYDELKNKFWVKTPINLLGIPNHTLKEILMLMNHLDNYYNSKIVPTKEINMSQSLIAKSIQSSLNVVKKQLKKLKEVQLIDWKNTCGGENIYTFNREKFELLVATINGLKLDERILFLCQYFGIKEVKSVHTHKHQKKSKIKQETINSNQPVEKIKTDEIA